MPLVLITIFVKAHKTENQAEREREKEREREGEKECEGCKGGGRVAATVLLPAANK